MNAQRRFVRKIVYLVAIAVLLLPLSILSQPGSVGQEGAQPGKLARLRSEHGLSQADLGRIDPSSASMRFATFGMHGLAASMLWSEAIDAKTREDWTRFDAALEQIANFQPNFVEVWQFQAWNVSYNLSVRFDDYRDRYEYVRRGLRFLERGIGYNDRATALPRDLAWFLSHKIGRSDERRAFRRLFHDDEWYHNPLPEDDWLRGTAYEDIRAQNLRDNWLVSHWWRRRVEDRRDANEIDKPAHNDTLFYREAPHALIEYAQTLGEEGEFGPVAERAWSNAAQAWQEYGNRPLQMRYGYQLRLLDYDVYRRRTVELLAELNELEPAWRSDRLAEINVDISSEQLAFVDKPWQECTPAERDLKFDFLVSLWSNPRELVKKLDDADKKAEGVRILDRFDLAIDRVAMIRYSLDLIAYESWRVRCEVERQTATIAARKAIYDGQEAMRRAQIAPALELYMQGIEGWKKVLDEHPVLLEDWLTIDDLLEVIEDYREVLRQNDQPFPEPFALQVVLDIQAAEQARAGGG